MEFVQRLSKLIAVLNISKSEFANKIGRSPGGVGDWFSGKSNPSKPSINAICKTFNVSEIWLQEGKGPMFNVDNTLNTTIPISVTAEEYNMITIYRHLSEKNKGYILAIMDEKYKERADR